MAKRKVNYYYDNTWIPGHGGRWTNDTEGNLVLLCDKCAKRVPQGEVEYAQDGEPDTLCECEYPGCTVHN
jgi:hypothetical protein